MAVLDFYLTEIDFSPFYRHNDAPQYRNSASPRLGRLFLPRSRSFSQATADIDSRLMRGAHFPVAGMSNFNFLMLEDARFNPGS